MSIEKGSSLVPQPSSGEGKESSQEREPFAEGLYVSWEVAPVCDLACPHCYALNEEQEQNFKELEQRGQGEQPQAISEKFNIKQLSMQEIEKGLDNLKSVGVQDFNIEGGEPTLRDDVVGIVRAAKERGFRTHISTHGMYLLQEGKEGSTLAERLQDAGLDTLAVSMDAPTKETNNRIRQKCSGNPSDHWSKAVEFFEWYGQEYEAWAAKGEKLYRLKVNTTVMQDNAKEVPQMGDLLRKYIPEEADAQLKLTQVHPRGKAKEEWEQLRVDDEVFQRVTSEARKQHGESLQIAVRPYKEAKYPFIVIGYNGTVVVPEDENQWAMTARDESGKVQPLNVRRDNFYDLLKQYMDDNPDFLEQNKKINTYLGNTDVEYGNE